MKCISFYITASSNEEAKKIAHALVEEKLAACVNCIINVISLYRWKGKVTKQDEVIIIGKTTDDKTKMIIDKVKSLHSYDNPAIVFWPIIDGSSEYLEWIQNEVK